jgi:hypothetical protein
MLLKENKNLFGSSLCIRFCRELQAIKAEKGERTGDVGEDQAAVLAAIQFETARALDFSERYGGSLGENADDRP